jgi:hypothetical protein
LWGGFDNIIYAISLLLTSIIVIRVTFYESSIQEPFIKTTTALVTVFLLLSTTNNPQWGMALAAAIGVLLFVMSVIFVITALDNKAQKLNFFTYITILFSIVFFLGGYSVGAIGALLLVLSVWVLHNRIIDFKILAISSILLVAVVIYITLLHRHGVGLLSNKPTSEALNLILIGQFGLIMTGSSLIGKAYFEQTQQLWSYYLCGAVLLFWSFSLFKEFIQRPNKERMFILAIATYSITNIVVVSLFRFRNGIEGALGQWYNVHTHFISVAVCYYLFTSIGKNKFALSSLIKLSSICVILGFATVGYYHDWKKSEYISSWKDNFVTQAPILLAFPDLISNKNDPFSTMLWQYPQAKAGIDFLYSNSLWIFKKNKPLTFGLTNDGWMEANKPVLIVCPANSKKINFQMWRPDGSQDSVVSMRSSEGKELVKVNNSNIQLVFKTEKPVILLDGSNMDQSFPITSSSDIRQLIAIINNISCEMQTEQVGQENSPAPYPLKSLEVNNWGPQSTKAGVNPNKQPDGSMGIWIENSGTRDLDELQVFFAGQPAKATSVQEKLITAAIAPDQITVTGDKEILIKQISTGKLFPVGTFKVSN